MEPVLSETGQFRLLIKGLLAFMDSCVSLPFLSLPKVWSLWFCRLLQSGVTGFELDFGDDCHF